MIRPTPELRYRFEQAANAISTEGSSQQLSEILSSCKIALIERRESGSDRKASKNSARVGIWRPTPLDDGRTWFMRDHSEPLYLWADAECIPPKGTCARVALLGESAARGYFYDPDFTFAAGLKAVLKFAGADDVEVIDLARTDIMISQLTKLMRDALALRPDIFVVFAGNNWLLHYNTAGFSPLDLVAILRRGGGTDDLREHCAGILRNLARSFIQTAASIAEEHGIPTIFVLPEFNLLDWRNERVSEMSFRSSEETTAWESAYEKAQIAVAEGDLSRVEELGRQLVNLDSGSAPAGFELLARCALNHGKVEEARLWFEAARDAGLFMPVMRSPRCYGIIQQVMRNEAGNSGLVMVDLPKCFGEYLSGALPDRRLFLDYCHLSLEGIRVAAAVIVEPLLRALGRPSLPWQSLTKLDFEVNPYVVGKALLKAAIHNAYWEQGRDIVESRCREALSQDASMAEIMLRFLDSVIRRAPSITCSSMASIATEASRQDADAFHFFHSLPPRKKSLNLTLIDALVATLTPKIAQVKAVADQLLVSEFSVTPCPVNLLERPYSSVSLEDWDWKNKTAYYRARERRSVFKLVSHHASPVRLTLTLRSRRSGQKPVSVYANGIVIASVRASANWTTWKIDIQSGILKAGVNSVAIEWPIPEFSREDRACQIADCLEHGGIPDIAVIYGEVFRFTAALSVPAENASSYYPSPVLWSDIASLLDNTKAIA